jgi:hypothetical protein
MRRRRAGATDMSTADVTGLRRRLHDVETDLRHARERIRQAEERAALAEKSCRDAWAFAKVILPVGSHLKGGV